MALINPWINQSCLQPLCSHKSKNQAHRAVTFKRLVDGAFEAFTHFSTVRRHITDVLQSLPINIGGYWIRYYHIITKGIAWIENAMKTHRLILLSSRFMRWCLYISIFRRFIRIRAIRVTLCIIMYKQYTFVCSMYTVRLIFFSVVKYTMRKGKCFAQSTPILPYHTSRGDYTIVVYLFALHTKIYTV